MPSDEAELRKLALRMGYADRDDRTALEAFMADYREKTSLNRKILDHLLHDAFNDDEQTEAETDLVLDPDPSPERIAEVLGKYRFRDVQAAYRNLMALSEEKIRFLSTRRCRQFLAAIASPLLQAVAATADADAALVNLDRVSESLGGKGVLWELFSFNPPSLKLYVELCAYTPHLSNILITNPGMIDGLMDSLVLDRLPTREALRETLNELCWAAEDIEPILHSFKNDQQLRVGVRDLLGKEDVQAATGTLSDIAEVCLAQIAAAEYQKLVAKFGRPTIGTEERQGEPCDMVIIALGKFGGREMNYRSDVDLMFLYEAEGQTVSQFGQWSARSTSNQHFFGELGQRIIKTASRLSAQGKLYEVDARLRPTGKSGSLAVTFDEFGRYFSEGPGELCERLALCKSRAVYGSPKAMKAAMTAVHRAAFSHRWRKRDATEIRQMRMRIEEQAAAVDENGNATGGLSSGSNIKRGPGGIIDIEFLVEMLQLVHARKNSRLRTPNTLVALDELRVAGILTHDEHYLFDKGYRLLRLIEGRLRLMNATVRNRLPTDPVELAKLAHLTRFQSSEALIDAYETSTLRIRERFEAIFAATET
jgi:glutamate-ammonia-ligase adenylyltransferase